MTDTPSAAGQPPAPAAPDYASMLAQIPDDVLQSDRRLQSRIGNLGQRFAESARQQIEAEAQRRETAAAEARLLELAEQDPFSFSAKYLKDHATSQARQEVENLRQSEQEALMRAVGTAYGNLPEWRDIMADPDNAQRLAQAVAGRQGADIVAAFNATALDLVAERRSAKRPIDDSEIEARVQERLAARLRGETVPDMSAARIQNINMASAISRMSDAEFDRFYKENILR